MCLTVFESSTVSTLEHTISMILYVDDGLFYSSILKLRAEGVLGGGVLGLILGIFVVEYFVLSTGIF